LLIDPEADSLEVVGDDGYEVTDDGVTFTAATYEELDGGGWGPVLLRIDDASDRPVGIGIEHFSKLAKPHWYSFPESSLFLLGEFVSMAQHSILGIRPEEQELFQDPHETPLRRENGVWKLVHA
jgi:hypothetical protein